MTTMPFFMDKLTSRPELKPGLDAGLDSFSLSRHCHLLQVTRPLRGGLSWQSLKVTREKRPGDEVGKVRVRVRVRVRLG